MATVKKQGRGYKITVSNGFDGAGNRIRQHTTWVPKPGMTPLQIEKELNRQVVLFRGRSENRRCIRRRLHALQRVR